MSELEKKELEILRHAILNIADGVENPQQAAKDALERVHAEVGAANPDQDNAAQTSDGETKPDEAGDDADKNAESDAASA